MWWIEIAIVVIALAAGVVMILAAMQPRKFRVERSMSMSAAPEKIFFRINDLHEWSHWSPFEKLDPNMKKTYSGPASGKGSVCAWEGNSKAGAGRMEIVETAEPQRVVIALSFFKPFKARNTAYFTIDRHDSSTNVTWAMEGEPNFVMKIFHVFLNMDKMLGKSFEEGLGNLKGLVEK
jgi:hypothetical protein